MTPKRLSIAAAAAGACSRCSSSAWCSSAAPRPPAAPSKLTLAQMRARLAGSPAPLAALHAQADELLAGGLPALRARLAALRGTPVVVNKWASWCEPCRAEFGVFQRVSVAHGREVAFIGIDSGDTAAATRSPSCAPSR